MAVDFGNGDSDDEADEKELLLLAEPHQPQHHLALRVTPLQQIVLATVVTRRVCGRHSEADGCADAPEGLLELLQQRHRQEAAVLHRNTNPDKATC